MELLSPRINLLGSTEQVVMMELRGIFKNYVFDVTINFEYFDLFLEFKFYPSRHLPTQPNLFLLIP